MQTTPPPTKENEHGQASQAADPTDTRRAPHLARTGAHRWLSPRSLAAPPANRSPSRVAEVFVAIAAAFALIPALGGSKTAWALLASYAYALALEWLGIEFWAPEWVLADLFVLTVILSPNMGLAEDLIAALMLPAFFGYAQGDVLNYEIGMGVVALQFLLTLPVRKWQQIIFSVSHGSLRAGKRQEVCDGGML